MSQQLHDSEQITGIVDADVDPAAGIQESKAAFAPSGGHDHDLSGTPTPAVLVVRRLRPTASAVPDFDVNIAASPGVSYPDVMTPSITAQAFDFSNPLPVPGETRIDLLYVDRVGLLQRLLGTPTTGTPVPPTHEGVFPIAEVGPIASGTTAITQVMIRDVRPFLSSGPLVRVKSGITDLGQAHTLVAGTNMTAVIVAGVATLSASGGAGSPSPATTAAMGIVRVTVDPPSGDPVALSDIDPRVTLAENSVQQDGSTPFSGSQSMDGFDLEDIGSLLFDGQADIEAAPGGDLSLITSGVGKVVVDSEAAFGLPALTSPTSPELGDIWYDPTQDTYMVRTVTGVQTVATTQTGTLGLAVGEILGDLVNPPTSGLVGDAPTLDFPDDLAADHAVRFAFQLPDDALLVEDVKIRLVFCMKTAGAGDVAIGFDYTIVNPGGDLTPALPTGNGTRIITPSTSAEVFQQDEGIVLPFGQLVSGAEVAIRLRRRSTDGADTRSGDWQLLHVIVVYAKKDIASERNVIEVLDEVTSLGQVTAIKFRGNIVVATEAGGIATIDLTDPGTLPATTSTLGTVMIQPAPASAPSPIAVGVNATYLPIQDEKNALAGTSGTPSSANKYVTNSDGRLPTQGENDALVGTVGTPGVANRYVTETDPVLPTQNENDALVGVGTAGPSGTNRYLLEDHSNFPTAGEKAALAGTSGTPSGGNRYLTQGDASVILANGTRPFSAPQFGVTPTSGAHLATKDYVDLSASSLGGQYAGHVQNLSALSAVPSASRVDKQLRLVEDEGAIYRFDIQGTGGGVPPNEGLGQWFKTASATQVHAQLTGLAADDHLQYIRVDGTRAYSGDQSFGGFQVTNFRIENRTSDPAAGSLGRLSFRTDLSPKRLKLDDGTIWVDLIRGDDTRLTDSRDPINHATDHQDGGGDEINVVGLSGRLADSQFVTIREEGIVQGQAHNIDFVGDGVTASAAGGTAIITVAPGAGDHAISHENGGADELDVAGLSGQLADRQKVRVQDEATDIVTTDTIDFQGAGVTATTSGGKAIVTIPGGGVAVDRQTFTTSGTWTKQAGVTSVWVGAFGGGGGGGGGNGAGGNGGGGGGGGPFVCRTFSAADLGATEAVTVGTGGGGGAGGAGVGTGGTIGNTSLFGAFLSSGGGAGGAGGNGTAATVGGGGGGAAANASGQTGSGPGVGTSTTAMGTQGAFGSSGSTTGGVSEYGGAGGGGCPAGGGTGTAGGSSLYGGGAGGGGGQGDGGSGAFAGGAGGTFDSYVSGGGGAAGATDAAGGNGTSTTATTDARHGGQGGGGGGGANIAVGGAGGTGGFPGGGGGGGGGGAPASNGGAGSQGGGGLVVVISW